MQKYPHHYLASAKGGTDGIIETCSPGLENIEAMPPREFDGPGDKWSPETMLVAAVASCFILTFRAVARAANFEWNALDCEVVGVLDREERITCFTEYRIDVSLHVPAGTDTQKAHHLAERSENVCLVTRSLTGKKILNVAVVHDS